MKPIWPKRCKTLRCRGRATSAGHSPYCPTCRRVRFKELHPLAYSWGNLKRRARQRGVAFTLTLEEYTAFAIKTDYAKLKGKTSLSLSLDRIDPSLGYHHWNIQAITVSENSRKQFVPYFNDGVPREILREYHEEEIAKRAALERLAGKIGRRHPLGSEAFWLEFKLRKADLVEV